MGSRNRRPQRHRPLQFAVDRIFRDRGTTLDAWLTAHRSEDMSLRQIADALQVATSVPVSHETVRYWLRHPLPVGGGDPNSPSSRVNQRSRDSVLVGADA